MGNGWLERIDHIVVLMLENRSFDCLLGYLYENDTPKHFVPASNQKPFDGVAGKYLYNLPHPHSPPDPANPRLPVMKAPWKSEEAMTQPFPDPGERYEHVNRQLFGEACLREFSSAPPMNGFVADYISVIEGHDGSEKASFDRYKIIMNCYPPEAIPVLSGLARDFAVCDEWFCSVPTQTFPNRSFFHSGSSHGFVNNSDATHGYTKWLENTQKTVFNLLSENGYDWRVYWDRQDLIGPFTRALHPPLYDRKFDRNFRPYGHPYDRPIPPSEDQFRKDCVAGNLPAYSFIEPRLFLLHNDMHPPVRQSALVHSSILAGEILINKIYEDIFIHGAKGDKTLLLITFDEHGGCYDHVSPPSQVIPSEPNPTYLLEQGFRFDRLGVRVPTILVSPWIRSGTVLRSSADVPFDHTSVIKTICKRWSLRPGHLTDRDKAAPDIWDVLNAESPRVDMPTYEPRPYSPICQPDMEVSHCSGLQRATIEHRLAMIRKDIPKDYSIQETLEILQRYIAEIYEV